jgi:hypothetical protein
MTVHQAKLTDFFASSPAQTTNSVLDSLSSDKRDLEKCHVRASAVCLIELQYVFCVSKWLFARDPCTCLVAV